MTNAQISTISVTKEPQTQINTQKKYDPRWNMVLGKNYECMVGLEICILPLPLEHTYYSQNKENGYKGFKSIKFNIHKDKIDSKRFGTAAPNNKENTCYTDLENKIFTITSYEKSAEQYPTHMFTLTEKDNPSNMCNYIFKHDYEYNTTFATMVHYQLLRDSCIGKEYIFDEYCLPLQDIETGLNIPNRQYLVWRCDDIITSPETGKLTMKLSSGNYHSYLRSETGAMEHSTSHSVLEDVTSWRGISSPDLDHKMINAYSKKIWDQYVEKYGEEMMNMVLSHKIAIGMPEEVVGFAIGRAKSVDTTSIGRILSYETKLGIEHCVIVYQNGKTSMLVYVDNTGIVQGWK